ncbi:N-acetyltransferase [Arthrobacter sp. MSA 4-2]|uniref:N-acetyltransferase n=1 Tax=Arthrobacter crusticola TaxID=2547960 RepID=A0A4R5TW50_9MICC|nr:MULTISPECIES: N-acetyltransferase [Arthrobacter]MBJ2120329.1 N-acetyltransferase [Arthrobacter sp. MSA 4-2]TDK25330.1 N-acetyltransferase [Arthrobacter crusticola]
MDENAQVLDHPGSTRPAVSDPGSLPRISRLALGATRQVDDAEYPADLSEVPTRQLRALCNRIYQLLDCDYPTMETRDRYEELVEELQRRESAVEAQAEPAGMREVFRDNVLFSRFELYRNGVMAGYVQYEMRGGDVLLLHAVVDPRFRKLGLEPFLMQSVLLNAHRRRLAITPYCPEAQEFLRANPHYLALLPPRQRRRFKVISAAKSAAQEGRR